jgi:hypothetical protein
MRVRLNECLANVVKAPEETEQLHWHIQASEAAEQLQATWEKLRYSAAEYVDLRQAKPFTLLEAPRLLATPPPRQTE